MYKTTYIFFISILCYNQLHSQIHSKKFYEKKFIDTGFTQNSPFFLAELTSETNKTLKERVERAAIRKLSSSLFIINNSSLFLSPAEKESLLLFPANNKWKLSPLAEKYGEKNRNTLYRYTIEITDSSFINSVINKYFPKANVRPQQKIISIVATFDKISDLFLQDKRVIYIDVIISKPAEELGTLGFDLSANSVNSSHSNYPYINGEGMHVSVKEEYYDTTDIDLKGRLDNSPLASENITNHANFMATIIAGAGSSIYYAKGAAPNAHISSSSFEQVLPDDDIYYTQNNITVQNHSYGTVIDNNYGLNAVAFDRSANNNELLLHVFSSGNTGNTASTTGNYAGIIGFGNMTGNFKMAKNVITVGATDTFGNPAALSSRGPAYDGRVKPDIAAFQKNGTSESAALVSGTAVLLQQLYKLKNNESLPSALGRAVLINSADDVFNPGPDYSTGFGNLNAIKAMDEISSGKYFTGVVTNGNTQVFNVTVPSGTSLLKVSLAWNDTTALPNAPTALVNDLDLSVASENTTEIWQPWVLSSAANTDSLSKNAVRKRDSLNNEEQITIDNPAAGNYKITVKGSDVSSSAQKFYIAYDWDSTNYFGWKNLSKADLIQSNDQKTVRWETNIEGTAAIEYAFPPFNFWQEIIKGVAVSKNFLYWNVPDTISTVRLRAKTGNSVYYSDTFLITTLLKPTTGFVCGDSVLLYWNKPTNINKYQVYQLGEKYMEPLVQTDDTAIVLSKSMLRSNYISVAPLLAGGTTGVKSYGFDYTAQGSGCYVNSFYADVTGSTALLTLLLGTLYKVSAVFIQKYTSSKFEDIAAIALNNQFNYTYNYPSVSKGITIFRAKIILNDGNIIYSDEIRVYYNEPGKYLLFPVPVKRNQQIEIFTPIPGEEILILADVTGRVVLKKQIQFVHEFIPTNALSPGIYIYWITKNAKEVGVGKLIVL